MASVLVQARYKRLHAIFNHSTTGFPLTGSHTVPPRVCTDCHLNNNYSLNSTLCYNCHHKDYAGTTNPVHAATGFPTTCELCHDTTVWTDSTFNHNNTAFPLTGSHTVPPRQCTDCHVNNNYTTLPTSCYGCHQTDYKNTTNPGHFAQPQFFPTTCQNCHNTTAWTGATFNHTQYAQFPITHGNAVGVCSTCHTNSNNYAIFQWRRNVLRRSGCNAPKRGLFGRLGVITSLRYFFAGGVRPGPPAL